MEKYKDIAELIFKYLKNDLTQEERSQLEVWSNQTVDHQQFFNEVSDAASIVKESIARQEEINAVNVKIAWEKLKLLGLPEELVEGTHKGKVLTLQWRKIAVAASILLFIVTGLYIWKQAPRSTGPPVVTTNVVPNDAKPHTKNAMLILDDGRRIVLDSIGNGLLAKQGGINITKLDNGVISYVPADNGKGGEMIYNTVYVPKGGDVVYLSLEDGSKVWLNAESSLRYPVAFGGEERKVEITGEAYFEVASSVANNGTGQKKRFIVSKGEMNVIVLGTKFNVNSYENEDNIKVTLLEGSVNVQSNIHGKKSNVVITPGQQAVLDDKDIKVISDVNVNQVMAWKNGKFVFKRTNIQVIMRQMERWYDLDPTQFEGEGVKQFGFNGEISRYNNASKVIELLEKTGTAKFKIEGKKIIVAQQ